MQVVHFLQYKQIYLSKTYKLKVNFKTFYYISWNKKFYYRYAFYDIEMYPFNC